MEIVWLLIIVTSIWVGIDAGNLGVNKSNIPPSPAKSFSVASPSSATEWFFACLLIWAVAFPWYLVKRSGYVRLKEQRESTGLHAVNRWAPPVQMDFAKTSESATEGTRRVLNPSALPSDMLMPEIDLAKAKWECNCGNINRSGTTICPKCEARFDL